ncbi:phospholipid-transporting ATPase ABCA3-like isoform X1 [Rhopilema esculentum]|uniref:phospholipid-transporting ATPase ABCA3-like isoform X1 n=1 Tax=Rhopilema esculentum TaxID=499914 RepID=UPI0031D35AD2
MSRNLRQLLLLLWKNFVLQFRRPIGTCIELLLPVALTAVLIIAKVGLKTDTATKCFSTFDARFVPHFQILSLPLPLVRKNTTTYLAFYPSNAWTKDVATKVSALLGPNFKATDKDLSGKSFTSEGDAAKEASDFFSQYFGAVIFEHSETAMPKFIKYKIRLSHQLQSNSASTRGSWQTQRSFPFFKAAGPRKFDELPDYSRRFLPLQYALDTTIARIHSNNINATVATTINQFPFPSYFNDPFIAAVRGLLPLLFTLAFIYTSIMIIKELVAEKQYRLKESMKMMGLSNWLHWLAWFIKNFIFLMLSTILVTILVKVAKIFEFSNGGVIFIFLIFYSVSAIFFCFLISVFFSNAIRGMLFGAVLWFASYAPYTVIANPATYDVMSTSEKAAACLLPNTCLGIGVQIISKYEEAQIGVNWSNFNDPPTIDENFSLAMVVAMMVVQSVVCWILTWYIEAVFPGEYGVPKPFYFVFTSSYWCGTSPSTKNEVRDIDMDAVEENEDVEEESAELEVGVSIQGLKKTFSSATGKKLAVDGLSLKMYKGQITALLGHNGAGKTTTMSILTGLYPPTEGTALVGNQSISTEMDRIRESLGLCPQHNVLFDRLTVKEHLKFFISLKGVQGQEAESKINAMLQDIQLIDKKDAQSKTLSGGMKRKLSCAIALIGDPEVVFLDEPTSGMDPSARRATWDLLQKHRGNKTMVLTTHFMDEADYLGDRIAIMADGRLRCCGSSLFLKKRYGVGYHLTLVKEPLFQENDVISLIREMVPSAKLVGNIGAEMSYILEHESSKVFKDLFAAFEGERGQKLGISSFGISITTMEEVFLKVGEGLDHSVAPTEQESQDTNDVKLLVDIETNKSELVTGFALGLSHFKAMFIKRFLNSKREKKAVVTQVLLPLIITLLGLLLAQNSPTQQENPARVMKLSSDLQAGARGNAYFADYRLSPDASFSKLVKKAYEAERLNVEDVTAYSRKIYTENRNDSIYSHQNKYTIGADFKECCNFQDIVLNSKCQAKIIADNNLCKDVKQFGYKHCYKCIDGGGKDCSSFTVRQTNLNDDLTYFTEVILEKSKGKKAFFDTHLAGITLQEKNNRFEARSWFSHQALHAVASAYSAANNIMLSHMKNDSSYGIQVTNHPLPRNPQEEVDVSLTNGANLTLVIFVTMAVCFIAASFITFIVTEKVTKAKHIQFVSGVGSFTYWFATYCWDLINFVVPAIGIIILFAAFQLDTYKGDDLGAFVVMLIFFGLSILPFVYLISFAFKSPLIAYSVVSMLLMLVSLTAVIAVFVCRIPQLGYLKEAEIMHHIFLLLPTYSFPQALMDIAVNYGSRKACTVDERIKAICKQRDTKWEESALAWNYPGSGTACLYMAVEAVIYFVLVLLIEENFFLSKFFANRKEESQTQESDSDVSQEQRRIFAMDEASYDKEAVVMRNVTKVYGGNQLVAVDHLSLGVPKRECFGLLGVNGAGKTTTFGMLTGELGISAGTAFLDGFNIQTQLRQVQQRIGYCPQFDALVDKMTGREMLQMFARLRGIRSDKMEPIVNAAIKQLNLSKWAEKMCGNYSGGNKRKLSTALALVGNPPIIFLDEPTSGMDPASRRFLWNTLSALLTNERSIILTSHSMEECEALCTRLAIMVNGKFKCLGSIQHLKNKYGKGLTLMIKVDMKTTVVLAKVAKKITIVFLTRLLTPLHPQIIMHMKKVTRYLLLCSTETLIRFNLGNPLAQLKQWRKSKALWQITFQVPPLLMRDPACCNTK